MDFIKVRNLSLEKAGLVRPGTSDADIDAIRVFLVNPPAVETMDGVGNVMSPVAHERLSLACAQVEAKPRTRLDAYPLYILLKDLLRGLLSNSLSFVDSETVRLQEEFDAAQEKLDAAAAAAAEAARLAAVHAAKLQRQLDEQRSRCEEMTNKLALAEASNQTLRETASTRKASNEKLKYQLATAIAHAHKHGLPLIVGLGGAGATVNSSGGNSSLQTGAANTAHAAGPLGVSGAVSEDQVAADRLAQILDDSVDAVTTALSGAWGSEGGLDANALQNAVNDLKGKAAASKASGLSGSAAAIELLLSKTHDALSADDGEIKFFVKSGNKQGLKRWLLLGLVSDHHGGAGSTTGGDSMAGGAGSASDSTGGLVGASAAATNADGTGGDGSGTNGSGGSVGAGAGGVAGSSGTGADGAVSTAGGDSSGSGGSGGSGGGSGTNGNGSNDSNTVQHCSDGVGAGGDHSTLTSTSSFAANAELVQMLRMITPSASGKSGSSGGEHGPLDSDHIQASVLGRVLHDCHEIASVATQTDDDSHALSMQIMATLGAKHATLNTSITSGGGIDTVGDGVLDSFDTTGDGKIDTVMLGGGQAGALPGGHVVGFDTVGDGVVDSFDTTGDGKIDTVMQSKQRHSIIASSRSKSLKFMHKSVRNLPKRDPIIAHRNLLIRLIGQVYEKKAISDEVSDREGHKRTLMPDFIREFFFNQFGVRKIADKNLRDTVHSVVVWSKPIPGDDHHRRIKTFGLLAGILQPDDNETWVLHGEEEADGVMDVLREAITNSGQSLKGISEQLVEGAKILASHALIAMHKAVDEHGLKRNSKPVEEFLEPFGDLIDLDDLLMVTVDVWRDAQRGYNTMLTDAFRQCDIDGDSGLGIAEFKAVLNVIDKDGADNDEMAVRMCKELWEALDDDEQMAIGLDELKYLCHRHCVGRDKHVRFLHTAP